MTFHAYADEDASEVYDNALRCVKGLWTLARREFSIHDTYEVVFGVCNPQTLGKLTPPYSHVTPRQERPPVVVLRVSKEAMQAPDLSAAVLPQEMAHVVCKIKPELGCPYTKDEGWQKVFRKLGGKC